MANGFRTPMGCFAMTGYPSGLKSSWLRPLSFFDLYINHVSIHIQGNLGCPFVTGDLDPFIEVAYWGSDLDCAGLFGLPLWLFACKYLPGSSFASVLVGITVVSGRIITASVELWVIFNYMKRLLQEDCKKIVQASWLFCQSDLACDDVSKHVDLYHRLQATSSFEMSVSGNSYEYSKRLGSDECLLQTAPYIS